MRLAILVVVLMLHASLKGTYAQPELMWMNTFGGRENEFCISVIQTEDGGYALAGYTDSFGEGRYDFWLVRTNEDGEELWSQSYGGDSWDYCYDLVETEDGGFLLVGATRSFDVVSTRGWVVKTNEDGDIEWSEIYSNGVGMGEHLEVVVITEDGDFVAAGHGLHGDEHLNFWLIKFDDEGDIIWNSMYGNWDDNECTDMIHTSDGGFALVGTDADNRTDACLLRIDEDGDEIWMRTYGGAQSDRFASLVEIADGEFVMIGSSSSFNQERRGQKWLVKVNGEGDEIWSQVYPLDDPSGARKILQTVDEGFLLMGYGGDDDDEWDVWLYRTDDEGEPIWQQNYGGNGRDTGQSFIRTADGGFAVGGSTTSFDVDEVDMWLLKLGRERLQWFPPLPDTSFFRNSSFCINSFRKCLNTKVLIFNKFIEVLYDFKCYFY